MPKIRPFKALVYSDQYASQLGALISPPYDVISEEGRQKLLRSHEYNSVQLSLANDPKDPERYLKMKKKLDELKEKKVLAPLSRSAFYLIEEIYRDVGGEHRRIGFVGLLRSTPFDRKEVLPHEHTLSGPKADRLELLKTMGAELSQIFLCYKDSELTLEKIYEAKRTEKPFREAVDPQGVARRLWLIDDESTIAQIQKLLDTRPVLIADGHHRYETSVNFAETSTEEKAKWVQCYFTNLEAPYFSIKPIHRVFSLPEHLSTSALLEKLANDFKVEDLNEKLSLESVEKSRAAKGISFFIRSQETGKNYRVSRPKRNEDDAEIFAIHRDLFEKVLEWDVSKLAKGVITYEHETEDFIKAVQNVPRGLGLFLPATDLNLVMRLAERGERMPQKSTFFFPKLASGLVNYELGSF